ncbi:MFS transporter [Nocardiopsis changdeensis]|uniref:MFS transporter n=1 Tax=Nocardiopsis changdeensis TaxID=2831969 RepID=A0ABX8BL73_9ACTN|nr:MULTISPECIES: MFS transporter [Nocardiopsis]QUX22767.1 MFS transporter [Nocardiopsis changdeensis]QYX38710.1 MFS transporter [Nocardiopsis sp. MT53]
MSFFGDLRTVLRGSRFRRLFGTRLVSQFSDGVYQAGLAGFVFFNPEQHTGAAAVAAAFAVLLLPFSVVAPFAGVLIDRWPRRQVLLLSALAKAALAVVSAVVVAGGESPAFFVAALLVLSVNRFFLSGLSAGLPYVVPREQLMMANAVTPTCGTVASSLGTGVGLGLGVLGGTGSAGAAAILVAAAAGFAAAGLVSLSLGRRELGPHLEREPEEVRAAVGSVVCGMVAGVRHIWSRPPARDALGTIGLHRVLFGISSLMTLLLYNNTFTGGGVAGLAGFSVSAGVLAVGFFLGAVATPWAAERMSPGAWIGLQLLVAAVVLAVFALPFSSALFPVAAFVLGFVSQGVKVTVDTQVQRYVDDAFRGRVFSVYDVLFNATFVLGAGLAAALVPPSGLGTAVVVGMVAVYLAAGLAWVLRERRAAAPEPAS